ncbi:MAG: double zinc ribbon domain-containing protein [Sphingomonadaceae bacterium]
MRSPCPPHWTFAARAAYFGDRMCAFCDHRNPGGAKFCNDCASPLHLKPCTQCDAVNDQAATNCDKCGAGYPALFSTPRAAPVFSAADSTPAGATPGDVTVAATAMQPLFAVPALRAGWRLLRPGQFLVAAIATILIVAAYDVYRINVATRDAMGVASQPVGAAQNNATTATPAVPVAVASTPVEPERTAALQAPIPATKAEASKRPSVRQRPVPVPATKRASARQRPLPERHAPVGATPPLAHGLAAARAGARVAQTGKALRPDPWRVMHVSLARCGGDLIARIVCDQRVRRRFCEGHWGEAPECASGIANDHGQ